LDIWERLTQFLLRLIDQYDAPGLALLVLLEEAGMPSPVPSDVLMVIAGLRAAQGEMNLVEVLVLAEVATVIGASVLYWLAARGGKPLLHRYGRFLRISPDRLDRAEAQLRRHGWVAVLVGRIIPGLRIVTPLAAGAFGVPYRQFLPAVAVGGFVYLAAFAMIGYTLGPRALELVEGVQVPLRAVITAGLFVVVAVPIVWIYRQAARGADIPDEPARGWRAVETAALAGLLATVEMAFAINLVLYGLALGGMLPPQTAIVRFLRGAAERYAAGSPPTVVGLGILVLAALGVGWALVYARFAADRLPGPPWLRGLLFAILPLTFSLFVLLPLLDAGVLGLGLEAGLIPAAGETLRHAFFGVCIGETYALLRAARDESPHDHRTGWFRGRART
jgi:membrane protein DedA with SNARE-associated domain